MEKITIKKIDIYIKDKEGNPLVGQYGPYTRLKITDSLGQIYWGYGGKITSSWQVGMTVSVKVEQSDKLDKNGRPYLNFRPLSQLDELTIRVENLEHLIAQNSPKTPSLKGGIPNGKLATAINDGYNETSQHYEDGPEEVDLPF